MVPASTGPRGQQQGRRTGGDEEASLHQQSRYLLGYAFKFISCQFTLESQPEHVHAALIMTITATIISHFTVYYQYTCTFASPVEWVLLLPFHRQEKLRSGEVHQLAQGQFTLGRWGCLQGLWQCSSLSTLCVLSFPHCSEGIPGLVIPSSEFQHLTSTQEVTDSLYKTRISFLNQIIGRYLNPNPYFYQPYRNYPEESRRYNRSA